MAQSPLTSKQRDEPDFNLREWAMKARISRENTNSRRFSASIIRNSFREDTRSFRSNFTISSTASSPGYSSKDEIDPSTYSFTTALRALQARSGYNSWECLSPDGFALNSKWNDAEKYICNPFSGEFPLECLSAKTLSGRSFPGLTNRITMSAPLVYSSNSSQIHAKPFISSQDDTIQFPIQEKTFEGKTRDVGTQSTPPDHSLRSLSAVSSTSSIERSIKECVRAGRDSPNYSNAKLKSDKEVEETETREKNEGKTEKEKRKKEEQMCRCSRQNGCLPWMRKRQREKHKLRNKNILLPSFKGC